MIPMIFILASGKPTCSSCHVASTSDFPSFVTASAFTLDVKTGALHHQARTGPQNVSSVKFWLSLLWPGSAVACSDDNLLQQQINSMQSPSKHSAVATGRSLAMRAFQTSCPVISRKQAPSKASKAAGSLNCSFVVVMALLALLLIMFVARARTPSRHAYSQLKTNCLSRINRSQQNSNSTTAAGVVSIAGEQVVWRRPVVVLLGDGLTEQASMEGGWAAKLAAAYIRKVRCTGSLQHHCAHEQLSPAVPQARTNTWCSNRGLLLCHSHNQLPAPVQTCGLLVLPPACCARCFCCACLFGRHAQQGSER